MPKTIDPYRQALYEASRKKLKTKTQSLRDAGYAENTCLHKNSVNNNKLVRVGEIKIIRQLKLRDLTIDTVLSEIDTIMEIANRRGDTATVLRGAELKGKMIAAFKENRSIQFEDISEKDRDIYSAYVARLEKRSIN